MAGRKPAYNYVIYDCVTVRAPPTHTITPTVTTSLEKDYLIILQIKILKHKVVIVEQKAYCIVMYIYNSVQILLLLWDLKQYSTHLDCTSYSPSSLVTNIPLAKRRKLRDIHLFHYTSLLVYSWVLSTKITLNNTGQLK